MFDTANLNTVLPSCCTKCCLFATVSSLAGNMDPPASIFKNHDQYRHFLKFHLVVL